MADTVVYRYATVRKHRTPHKGFASYVWRYEDAATGRRVLVSCEAHNTRSQAYRYAVSMAKGFAKHVPGATVCSHAKG